MVLVSGSPVVSRRFVYPFLGILGLVYLIYRFREKDVKKLAVYISCLCILFVAQKLVLGTISVPSSANYLCKLLFGTAVFMYVGDSFRDKFLDVMAVIGVVSIVFWLFQISGLSVPSVFPTASEHLNSVFVHNVNTARNEYLRNCGPFWEPGAYVGFLFLSLILFLDNFKGLIRKKPWHVGIILATMLTTMSTGGYICIAMLTAYFLIVEMFRNKWWYYLTVTFIVACGVVMFLKVPFLGEKIIHQLTVSSEQRRYDDKPEYFESRTGAFVVDFYYVGKHPVVGNGSKFETRFSDHFDQWDRIKKRHSNGFSNLFAQFGIPIALLYFVLLYFRLPFKEYRKWFFMLFYVFLMQEEMFLNFPLFISMPFILLPGGNKQLKANECNTN